MNKIGPNKSALKILIADDHATARGVVHAILVGLGYLNIYQASTGIDAIKLAVKQQVDLIICDWHMPGATGLEVLKVLRETKEHRNTPFVLLTSEAMRDRVKQAYSAGVSRYMIKPFTAKQLEELLAELLGTNSDS